MTLEQEIKEQFDRHWKGFMAYDDYARNERAGFHKEYSVEQFYHVIDSVYRAGIRSVSPKEKETDYHISPRQTKIDF